MKFGKLAKTAALGVAGVGVASAAAAAGGLSLLTKAAFKSMDAIGKTADRLGLTTEKLVGLQHAAELSGIGVQTLDMALQRSTRRIAEAGRGTGEAKNAIKELGLSAKDLAKLSPDKQLEAIADALQGVQTQGDKVRLAMKLFDSEGVKVVNMLQGGSKGLREMMDEAKGLGLTFGRLDAGKIEAANDAIARAKAIMVGLGREVAVGVAPHVERLANVFREMASGVVHDIGRIIDELARMGKIIFSTDFLEIDLQKRFWTNVLAGVNKSTKVGIHAAKKIQELLDRENALLNRISGGEPGSKAPSKYTSPALGEGFYSAQSLGLAGGRGFSSGVGVSQFESSRFSRPLGGRETVGVAIVDGGAVEREIRELRRKMSGNSGATFQP